MPVLHITRGLPGSGKTTYAQLWVHLDRAHRARVNRDDLRQMFDGGAYEKGVTEGRILAARDTLILGLLVRGVDVVCDDTNLPQRTVRDLSRLARRAGATFEVMDFTDVGLDECVERDNARQDKLPVGPGVIRDMHDRYLKGKTLPLPVPALDGGPPDAGMSYVPVPGTPKAVIVDIDGTVALHGTRSPFDESRVHEDRPNPAVIDVVLTLHHAGHRIIFVSGRTAGCRDATERWLRAHVVATFSLYMRAVGDTRKDSMVKQEIFDCSIRPFYDVAGVFDDRNQVVEMWRAMGLTVFQVADGNF